MKITKNIKVAIILILSCIVLPVFAAEPNEPNNPAGLNFKISATPTAWSIIGQAVRGPIRPKYVVMFYIKRIEGIPNQQGYGQLETSVQTNLEKYISSKQKEFIATSSCYEQRLEPTAETPIGYIRIRLYAVSQEDAKNMAQGIVELINKNIEINKINREEYLRRTEQELSKNEKELAEKEIELKNTKESYNNTKEGLHMFSSDDEAVALAKKSIIEMDKTLDEFKIELAGIQEKIKTIEKYRKYPSGQSIEANIQIKAKLDLMFVDLMIELSGIEAQMNMTENMKKREQEFVFLFNKKTEMTTTVKLLRQDVANNKNSIEGTKNVLSQTPLTADIFQNTVTIVPVAEESELRYR